MKTLLWFTLILAMSIASLSAADGPVRHVVSFRFKPDLEPAKIQEVEKAFAALKGKVPVVEKLEWGTNVSPEKHDKGFTHIWIATFKSPADRDAYLVHPAHKEFAQGLKGLVDDVFVLDFVPQE